jgi:sulfite exporter TauE/SafE
VIVALCLSTFAASVLGSVHCAGMCGIFAAAASCQPGASGPTRARLVTAYSFGRLTSYVSLGALSGILGQGLNLTGNMAGLGHAAIILAAAVVGIAGAAILLRACGIDIPRIGVPRSLLKLAEHAHRSVGNWPPLLRALAIGLFTTLLPCHWLYTFVATSAGTGSAWQGALVMATFWLGTLPVMITMGATFGTQLGSLRKSLPIATALVMVAVSAITIFAKVRCCDTSDQHQEALLLPITGVCNGPAPR